MDDDPLDPWGPEVDRALHRIGYDWARSAAQRAFADPVRVHPEDEEMAALPAARRRQTRWDHTGLSVVVALTNNRIIYIKFPNQSEGDT